ncbi:MAG: phage major capsid protein [Deltaproteobacteria bacterium]|nr:MAG: phage major capsid protein [Deltaproteobacteria bacterium]
MGQTYALYVAMLKEFYGTTFQETFNNENMLKKYLEESTKEFDGLRVNYPVHYGRNTGVGARSEGAALPTAGYQKFAGVYVTAAYLYGRMDITGQAMAASKKTAFAEAMATEMEGVKTDLMFDVGRQCYGEGLGILAECGADSCATAVSVKNRFYHPGEPGGRYFQVGQYAAVGSATDFDEVTSGTSTVTTIAIASNSGTTVDTVSFSASIDTITACKMFLFSFVAGGPGIELKGLRSFIDDQTATNAYGLTGGMYGDDTIFNVDRGTVAGWNSYVDGNSGVERLINNTLLQRAESRAKKKGGKAINIHFGEYDVIDAFADSVAGDRRFNTKNFDAGVESLTFNGKAFVKDLNAPYNELFGLHKAAVKWYVLQNFGFDDLDGSVLKNVAGYDKNEAFIKGYMQVAPGEDAAPNSCFAIRDIKVDLV